MLRIGLIALICLASLSAAADVYKYTMDAEPKQIQDGDTAYVSLRFFGIDTPESAQHCARSNGQCYACGEDATQALRELIGGKSAKVKLTGESTYGRPVATVFVGGKDMNLEMVRLGWATVYERYIEDDAMKRRYLDAQEDAKAAKRGIWQGEFVMPHMWRRGERLACE